MPHAALTEVHVVLLLTSIISSHMNRDISCENTLISPTEELTIIDLGMSRLVKTSFFVEDAKTGHVLESLGRVTPDLVITEAMRVETLARAVRDHGVDARVVKRALVGGDLPAYGKANYASNEALMIHQKYLAMQRSKRSSESSSSPSSSEGAGAAAPAGDAYCGFATDVWAAGIIFFALLTGRYVIKRVIVCATDN